MAAKNGQRATKQQHQRSVYSYQWRKYQRKKEEKSEAKYRRNM